MSAQRGDAFEEEWKTRPDSAGSENWAGRERLGRAGLDYRGIVEQSPTVAYAGWADEVGLIYISPQVEGMFGYAPEEWFSDPGLWSKALHPEDREWVFTEAMRVREAGSR